MNINEYLERQYPAPGCWALVADVYAHELQTSVLDYSAANGSARAIAYAFRLALHRGDHGFLQLAEPVDMAVVLLGKSPQLGVHHCGIYYAGRVLHVLPTLHAMVCCLQHPGSPS